jgi:endonuclease YncB( thermonuclease family)
LVLGSVALTAAFSRPESFDGSRAIIVDGDTFALGKERVRILNIDAPESFRSRCDWELTMGLKAKERLAGRLRAGQVQIYRHGEDRYGRTLARVVLQTPLVQAAAATLARS